MVEIINLTPHPLNLKRVDGTTLSIPPSGTVARVAEQREALGALMGLPVTRASYGAVEGLPAPTPGRIYVVSALVLAAVQERPDVFAPGPAIRDAEGKIVGADGLSATAAYVPAPTPRTPNDDDPAYDPTGETTPSENEPVLEIHRVVGQTGKFPFDRRPVIAWIEKSVRRVKVEVEMSMREAMRGMSPYASLLKTEWRYRFTSPEKTTDMVKSIVDDWACPGFPEAYIGTNRRFIPEEPKFDVAVAKAAARVIVAALKAEQYRDGYNWRSTFRSSVENGWGLYEFETAAVDGGFPPVVRFWGQPGLTKDEAALAAINELERGASAFITMNWW